MTPLQFLEHLNPAAHERINALGAVIEGCVVDGVSQEMSASDIIARLQAITAIIHAIHDANSVMVLADVLDPITGLTRRECWSFEFVAGLVARVVGCVGVTVQSGTRSRLDDRFRDFGFVPTTNEHEPLVRTALQAVTKELGHPLEETPEVLINDDLLYIAHTWIGCGGLLYVRANGAVIVLGSADPAPVHVWSFYRGFSERGNGTCRLNDLVITAIRDYEATRAVLRKMLLVLPSLEALPIRIPSVDLYSLRAVLWRAELRGLFSFQVEPTVSDLTVGT